MNIDAEPAYQMDERLAEVREEGLIGIGNAGCTITGTQTLI
jgi:hypothetical protein